MYLYSLFQKNRYRTVIYLANKFVNLTSQSYKFNSCSNINLKSLTVAKRLQNVIKKILKKKK